MVSFRWGGYVYVPANQKRPQDHVTVLGTPNPSREYSLASSRLSQVTFITRKNGRVKENPKAEGPAAGRLPSTAGKAAKD
jgi:hypothetical protein